MARQQTKYGVAPPRDDSFHTTKTTATLNKIKRQKKDAHQTGNRLLPKTCSVPAVVDLCSDSDDSDVVCVIPVPIPDHTPCVKRKALSQPKTPVKRARSLPCRDLVLNITSKSNPRLNSGNNNNNNEEKKILSGSQHNAVNNLECLVKSFSKTGSRQKESISRKVNESEIQTYGKYAPSHWTQDMKDFYCKPNPEAKNLTLEKVLSKMSDRKPWPVDDQDWARLDPNYSRNQHRYSQGSQNSRTPAGYRSPKYKFEYCKKCRRMRRAPCSCLSRPGKSGFSIVCYLCGVPGHLANMCQDAMCLKCGAPTKPQNMNLTSLSEHWSRCENCVKMKFKSCRKCGKKGHTKIFCPDLWLPHEVSDTAKYLVAVPPQRISSKKRKLSSRRQHSDVGAEQQHNNVESSRPKGPSLAQDNMRPASELWCSWCCGNGHVYIQCSQRPEAFKTIFVSQESYLQIVKK